jgi:hypothetical protein
MKKSDTLKQFVVLYQTLRNEKAQLESRLAEINEALGHAGAGTQSRPQVGPTSPAPRTKARHRIENPISLPKAVLQLTSKRPMTKQEILSEVDTLGYRFTAKDPINSLNTVLYGQKPKFKHDGGKFSPVGVQVKAEPSGATPAKPRRKMSAAAKAKISAAATARWAKVKQGKG